MKDCPSAEQGEISSAGRNRPPTSNPPPTPWLLLWGAQSRVQHGQTRRAEQVCPQLGQHAGASSPSHLPFWVKVIKKALLLLPGLGSVRGTLAHTRRGVYRQAEQNMLGSEGEGEIRGRSSCLSSRAAEQPAGGFAGCTSSSLQSSWVRADPSAGRILLSAKDIPCFPLFHQTRC